MKPRQGPSTTVIRNGLLVTLDSDRPVISDGYVQVQDRLITAVGSSRRLRPPPGTTRIIEARGCVVMPGYINSHTHLYGAFARGMPMAGRAPRRFTGILKRVWWRLDRQLSPSDVYHSALLGFAEAARSGVTTVFDHHSSPACPAGSLDLIAQAARRCGLRACLSYEVSDRDGPVAASQGIEENARFAGTVAGSGKDDLAASFGLHASFTLSDRTLKQAVRAAHASDLGFHLHVAEDIADLQDAQRRGARSVVARLSAAGILGPRTLAAHCVHVSWPDLALLARQGVLVVHNPRSNMNNAVGCAPVAGMLERGITVGLGTDGISQSVAEEARAFPLLHRAVTRDPRSISPDDVMETACRHNARIAGKHFPHPLGVLKPGACADIILVEYRPGTPLTPRNLAEHFYWGITAAPVSIALVGGKIILRDRRLLTVDEEETAAASRSLARSLWRRLG